MKYTTLVAALAGAAMAFPNIPLDMAAPKSNKVVKRADSSKFNKHAKRLNGINPGFNAEAQYISTSGQYAWVAPSPTDLRGPCPGLNAMANHGYLPHNGYATIPEFIQSCFDVFGMGLDLGGFLAVYGAIFDGDLTGWSIAGPAPPSLVNAVGLIAPAEGISGSHNKYEGDVSPTRGDLFQYGNDYLVVTDQFKGLYEYQASQTNEASNYDLGILTDWRVARFAQSTDNNPYFFNGPFSGVFVESAAYTFIQRFMSNKSADNPEGILTQDVLKDFFSITGDYPDFTYTAGYERIPDNWYKRAIGDEYTIPFFLEDTIAAAVQFPQFFDVGGNLGKTNSFTPIDLLNVTGGAFDVATLAEGDNLSCFFYEILIQAAPDFLEDIFLDIAEPLSMLTTAAGSAFDIGCTNLNSVQQGQFSNMYKADGPFAAYPGFTQLKTDGTYPAQ